MRSSENYVFMEISAIAIKYVIKHITIEPVNVQMKNQNFGLFLSISNCLDTVRLRAVRNQIPFTLLSVPRLNFCFFRNRIQEVPYFMCVDKEKKSLIISIRGTLSISDMFTGL